MTRVCNWDAESRATVDLTVVGAHVYWAHPQTRLLCVNYTFDKGKTIKRWRVWESQPMPADLREALEDPDCLFEGWNANFERLACKHGMKIEVPIKRFRCTMARARSMALPGKLELCAKALSMPIQKADSSIMMKWCKPLPDGTWADDPAEYEQLLDYCDIDILTEIGLGDTLRDLSDEEWRDYHINETINDRGIPVDTGLAQAAQRYAKDELNDIKSRLNILTKGVVTSPKQFQRIKKWLLEWLPPELQSYAEPDDTTGKVSFDAATREELLADDNADVLVGDVREFVELIHDGGRASTAKFAAMQARAGTDQRVRGAYVFNGAGQTHRFCVASDTLVDTYRGPRFIAAINPSYDWVRTHTGAFHKVLNLFYKGEETMYDLRVVGGRVTCTAGHRILTTDGWMRADDFAHDHRAKTGTLRAIHASTVQDDRRDRRRDEGQLHGVTRGTARTGTPRSLTSAHAGELFALEAREEKPDVRLAAGAPDHTRWICGDLARRRERSLRAVASRHDGESIGFDGITAASGSAPYRRGQAVQPDGQLRALYEEGSPAVTRGTLEAFEIVGSRGVWDIEVAVDHSYTAQGLIHHNSSHGLQVHNFIRAGLVNIEAVVEAVLRGVPKKDLIDIASYAPDGSFVFDKSIGGTIGQPYNVLTILSRLLRPSIVADDGKILVWGDWSSIEAVVNPWLSKENSASELLDYFAAGKDLYLRQAVMTYGLHSEEDVTSAQRQAGGKVPCIAEGQLVLTPRGLVPIEQIEKSDQTWDGFRWTTHAGVVYKGLKDVWEYQGLVATEDHIVYTQDGRTLSFGQCAREQIPLAQTGSGWATLRLGDDYIAASAMDQEIEPPRTQRRQSRTVRALQWLSNAQMDRYAELAQRQDARLSTLFATADVGTEMAGAADGGRETPLRKFKQSTLFELWWPRNQVQFSGRDIGSFVGGIQFGIAERQGDRSPAQRWTLRARQPEMVNAQRAGAQSTAHKNTRMVDMVQSVRVQHDETYAAGGVDQGANISQCPMRGVQQTKELARYRGKARVYDIVNAGPLHRFTVSNVLVHNCLSFGFGGGAGAAMRMARAYNVDMDHATADLLKVTWRRSNPWAERFWRHLETAAFNAVREPGTVHHAGRVAYMCAQSVLWCLLPSGKMLAYPFPRVDTVDGRFGPQDVVTCIKGSFHPKKDSNYWPRMRLWGGMQAENVTQAEAASLLRWGIRELYDNDWPVIGHTHDELLGEIEEEDGDELKAVMRDIMTTGPAWAAGLPLRAEVLSNYVYGK